MQRLMLGIGAVGAIATALPGQSATPNDMRNGTWRGWLLQQDQDSIQVTYAVSHYDKHPLITLRGRRRILYDMSYAKGKSEVLPSDGPMGLSADR